ncbi:MAG TPA: metallophosphoesterase [Methylomirabilota bacterium]|nr:metallophosphoesterase [Methylomirabilota bacterium]
MNRRTFLATAAVGSAALPLAAQNYSDYTKDPRPDIAEGTFTAGSAPGPVFKGSPVVSGPAPEAITILQPLQRYATGFLEFAVESEPYRRVNAGQAGLLPLAEHVLKFQLPPLPPGKSVRYRITARTAGWVKVRQFYHGELKFGELQTSPEYRFRTLDAAANTTTFAVWNDTHENAETIKALHGLTAALKPDVLLWNGDQSNDVHFEKDMAGQFLSPAGLSIAERWPLAYVRGNHDVRGPAARRLADFTATPEDRFYYAFRSGPVAALVMDTGEDKPDDSEVFGGLVAFQKMQQRQAEWLDTIMKEAWFREAPHKVMFCHIPLWFTRDIFPTHRRWECHDVCRKLWAAKLAAAGVKLVVSGHTHAPRWMPAKEGQPIAQLIGGGPEPRSATFIQITATRDALTVKMTKLDGTVAADVTLKA